MEFKFQAVDIDIDFNHYSIAPLPPLLLNAFWTSVIIQFSG